MKIRMLLILAVLASVAFGQLSYTHILDTLKAADGSTNFDGSITISWPDYIYGGVQVPAGNMQVTVVNGVLNVSLVPTDRMTCKRDCTYMVTYVSQGSPVQIGWLVPTASGTVSLATIKNSAGGTSAPVTIGNCTVGGSSNGDLSCPTSVQAGDASTSGAMDLKAKTSGNIVTETVDDSSAAYTLVKPAAAPTAAGQTQKSGTNSGGSIWPFTWDSPVWAGSLVGGKSSVPTFDTTVITAGDCTAWGSLKQLISQPCSGAPVTGSGATGKMVTWTSNTALGASTNWSYDGATLIVPGIQSSQSTGSMVMHAVTGSAGAQEPYLDFRSALWSGMPAGGGIRWLADDGTTVLASIMSSFSGSETPSLQGFAIPGSQRYTTGYGGADYYVANSTNMNNMTTQTVCTASGGGFPGTADCGHAPAKMYEVVWNLATSGTCTNAGSCTQAVQITFAWQDVNGNAVTLATTAGSLDTDVAEVKDANYGAFWIHKNNTSALTFTTTATGGGGTSPHYQVNVQVIDPTLN